MPIQTTHSDVNSAPQKLSKIETLRMARNYIIAMTQTLQEGTPMDIMRFIKVLSRELSQTTANLLSGTLLSKCSNQSYRNFYSNETQVGSNQNYSQEWSNYKTQYMMYGENYGQFWDYNKSDVNQDCRNNYGQGGKYYNSLSRFWDCSNNVHYPYGSYQYVTWQ